MTTVLFAIAEAGEFVELRRLIPALRQAGASNMAFAFTYPGYKQLEEHSAWCFSERIPCYDQSGTLMREAAITPSAPRPQSQSMGMRSRLRRLKDGPVGDAIAFGRALRDIRHKRTAARKVLDSMKPGVVVVGHCSAASETHILLSEARKRRIRTVLVPFAISHLRGQLEPLKDNRLLHARARLTNSLAGRMCPEWLIEYEQRLLLRLPGPQILARRVSGLKASRPWYPNSEGVDLFAADSERGHQRLVELGADPARIAVTGSPIHDTLFEVRGAWSQRRNEMCRSANLDPTRPVIVCSWPSNQFLLHRSCDEFKTYLELSSAWAEALSSAARRHDVGVLVSRHPKTPTDELAPAVSAGLKVIDSESAYAIPICDVMVGSVTSIIAWAIACGIPVVNYDVYRYRYGDYTNVPGVIEVEHIQAFNDALDELCGNEARRRTLTEAQRSTAATWGILDGEACARIALTILKT